jgi:hypothetical protein
VNLRSAAGRPYRWPHKNELKSPQRFAFAQNGVSKSCRIVVYNGLMQAILGQRKLGPFTVSSIGLGCMNLSHAYGVPPSPDAAAGVLLRALDLGVTHFDTAALYGFGANEELVGRTLAQLDSLINQRTVVGERYNPATQAEVDTENFWVSHE